MIKNIFQYVPEDFFKPLASKYKREYAECIQLIFHTFKSENSYGINREIVTSVLEDYFSNDETEMFFDESEQSVKGARDKANIIIRNLKNCGWIEYETMEGHLINVTLNEYAVPIIESFEKIIRDDETEYQGIISQIYSTLLNQELYVKPYELILKGVNENTDRLLSELKKLSASIKRHIEKQTNEMGAAEVLEHLFQYHQNIGSKAYKRMKTSENLYYFRSEIIEKLEEILSTPSIMELACKGYMEVEGEAEYDIALEQIVGMILNIKSSFHRLDDIIEETDKKHAKCIRSAVMRAKFLLSTGNNMEGKILGILNACVSEMNQSEYVDIYDDIEGDLFRIVQIYPQRYIEGESLRTIPVLKQAGVVDEIGEGEVLSEQDRALYQEALRYKNRNRFTRKNINAYVETLLENRDRVRASSLEIENKRDVIRLIYISIYGNNKSNCYQVERSNQRIKVAEYEIPDFEIVKL